MAKSKDRRSDGEAWFAEEKFGHELYHAKVGEYTIVVAIGNVATVPIKKAEERREHFSKVVADNVQRFFLSSYSAQAFSDALTSQTVESEMHTRKCAEWIESQGGRHPRDVILEARRRFAAPIDALLFGQFERAVGRQARLSKQEWEVARRLANGIPEKEIANGMKSIAKNNHLRRAQTRKAHSEVPGADSGSAEQTDQGLSTETVRKVVKALRQKAGGSPNRAAAVYWFLGFEL